MDSFEINKIVAALLVVFLVVFGIGKISDIVFHVEKPNTSAYKVEFAEVDKTKASSTVQTVDITALIGHYLLVGQILSAFEVDLAEGMTAEITD